MLRLLVAILFGSPRAMFAARILAAMHALAPCSDAACVAHHERAASAIAYVSAEDRDPEDAAARLLGVGVHETGFRTDREAHGGPAVTWFQLEVPRRERAALLADPVAAARLALRRSRTCGGNLACYASGTPGRGGEVGRELARYVASARFALAAH